MLFKYNVLDRFYLLLEAKLFPAINKKIERKVLRSILIFSTNQPLCTYVAAMINYQNFHSKKDAAYTCHFTTSCSCWVKAVAKLALKTFYQNVFILTHIHIEFPLQKFQNQFLLTILCEQTFEVTKFGNMKMSSQKEIKCFMPNPKFYKSALSIYPKLTVENSKKYCIAITFKGSFSYV